MGAFLKNHTVIILLNLSCIKLQNNNLVFFCVLSSNLINGQHLHGTFFTIFPPSDSNSRHNTTITFLTNQPISKTTQFTITRKQGSNLATVQTKVKKLLLKNIFYSVKDFFPNKYVSFLKHFCNKNTNASCFFVMEIEDI